MGTQKHDHTLLEYGNNTFGGSRLTATFFDRRFELYAGIYGGHAQFKSIRDEDGNVIIEAQDAAKTRTMTTVFGTRFDMTDDYLDPRRGFRFEMSRWSTPPMDLGPDFFYMDYSATAYVPLGKASTWAFNYFRSDAYVLSKGETDPDAIARHLGLNCSTITDLTAAGAVPAGHRQRNCCEYVRHRQFPGRAQPFAVLSRRALQRRAHAIYRDRDPLERHGRIHTVQYRDHEGRPHGLPDRPVLRDRDGGGPAERTLGHHPFFLRRRVPHGDCVRAGVPARPRIGKRRLPDEHLFPISLVIVRSDHDEVWFPVTLRSGLYRPLKKSRSRLCCMVAE